MYGVEYVACTQTGEEHFRSRSRVRTGSGTKGRGGGENNKTSADGQMYVAQVKVLGSGHKTRGR